MTLRDIGEACFVIGLLVGLLYAAVMAVSSIFLVPWVLKPIILAVILVAAGLLLGDGEGCD